MGISFNSTVGQGVNFGVVPVVSGISQISILSWLTLDSVPTADRFAVALANVPDVDDAWTFYISRLAGNSYWAWYCEFTGGNGLWRVNSTPPSSGSRLHYAVTHDRSSASNDPIFYIGGVAVASTEVLTPSGSVQSGNNGVVGVGAGGAYAPITGTVDSAPIYNRILSAAEIADAYNSRLAIPSYRGLVFAPNLLSHGEVGEGGVLTSSHGIVDNISGALGTPSGSPLYHEENYLTWE